jgi:hypothetical protein
VFALDGDAIDATIRAFFLSFRHLPENQVSLSGSDQNKRRVSYPKALARLLCPSIDKFGNRMQ